MCVYNNSDILKKYLLKSLEAQTADYELILLDNTGASFSSASHALNQGGNRSTSKYILFIHQDIYISSKSWLKDVEQMLDSLPNLGIAGVAGVSDNLKGVSTNIFHGNPPVRAGQFKVEKPVIVQTVDECLVIIPRAVFDLYRFDEDVCDGWHLYAVDYSLSIKQRGCNVFVLPSYIYHRSTGVSISLDYYLCLIKVMRKHKESYPIIYTTVGNWDSYKTVYLSILKYYWIKTLRILMQVKRLLKERFTVH